MKKTKLFTLLCIVVAVLFLATACGGGTTSTYKDGTYEGVSDKGMSKGLKVSVTITGDKITEVKVVEHGETQGIGTRAVDELPAKIVEAQSADVDSVGGASLSSAAIKEAVTLALEQAKNK